MKKYIKSLVPAAALLLSLGTTSCTGDLDVTPIDPNFVEVNPELLFTKCYATMAAAGNGGADGDSDVDGIDGGTSGYYRQMWNAQDLTSDEAVCGWGDEGIPEYSRATFDASHPMLRGYYYRLYTAIAFCNQYLQDYSDYDATMTAEIRFLRAFHYYNLLDGWGNVPMATSISSEKPKQASRQEVFDFVQKELLELEPNLSDAKAKKSTDAGYGRVDKASAWMLLARLYLNAKVYTGVEMNDKAAEYAQKVINSDYKLNTAGVGDWTAYQMLFMADNGETNAAYEIIFPLLQDGKRTTSWGTSLFLIGSTFDGDMHENPYDEGPTNGTASQQWGGNRATKQLVEKFITDAPTGLRGFEMRQVAGDDRAMFNSVGREIDNEEEGVFKSGYAVAKFNNFKSDGTLASDPTHPDMDCPVFRKGEAYLIYAEALTRQNNGNAPSAAIDAINQLRMRANASTISKADLNFICDEWSREMYFEAVRRSTLIRFDRFAGEVNYNWDWKGGSKDGRNIPAYRNLFAIPTTDLTANDNLHQNPGYGN